MIIFFVLEALVGFSLFRWIRNWHQRRTLKSWATQPTVPVFSAMLRRASGGDIENRRHALIASVFKSGVRRYVESDLFDSAVAGMFNRESFLHTLGRKLKTRLVPGNSGLISEEGPVSEAFL